MEAIEFGRELQTFKDFRPTQFDMRGMGSEGQEDWRVLPTSITRDSDVLSESNFETAQKILDDAEVEYEVHRFGHWGPGWFEIIVVEPTEKGLTQAGQIASSLESYPILDESDLSERETEASLENWENWGRSETLDRIVSSFGLEEDTRDFLEEHDEILDGLFHGVFPEDPKVTIDGLSGSIDLTGVDNMTRDELAGLIRAARRKEQE